MINFSKDFNEDFTIDDIYNAVFSHCIENHIYTM